LTKQLQDGAATLNDINPSLRPVADAVRQFVAAKNGTLTIRLTPKERVPLMRLIADAKDDPSVFLAKFKIEATATR
jgi:hypothetical protein